MGKATGKFFKETSKVLKETFSNKESSSETAASTPSPQDTSPEEPLEKQKEKTVEVEDVDEALVEVESYMTPYIYDPLNRRDPFEDPMKARLRLQGPIVEENSKTSSYSSGNVFT